MPAAVAASQLATVWAFTFGCYQVSGFALGAGRLNRPSLFPAVPEFNPLVCVPVGDFICRVDGRQGFPAPIRPLSKLPFVGKISGYVINRREWNKEKDG